MARCDNSILRALDLVEYAETAAHYEYLNLLAGEKSEGLTPGQIRSICVTHDAGVMSLGCTSNR